MLLTSTLLAALPLIPLPQVAPPDVLSAVPAGAHFLMYCDDLRAFRKRAERNVWTQSQSGDPAPLVGVLLGLGGGGMRGELGDALQLAGDFSGAGLYFQTTTGTGFLCAPTADRETLRTHLLSWLLEDGAGVPPKKGEWHGGTVLYRPRSLGYLWRSTGESRWAALVDHQGTLGLFAAGDESELLQLVRSSLLALERKEEAPITKLFRAARKDIGPMGVELFRDFTPLVADAQRAMEESVTDFFIDPERLLGIEEGAWFYATGDFLPGRRLEMRAHLEIPRGGFMQALADTFSPLPADLLLGVPKHAWSLGAWNWDLMAFYDHVRQALAENGQEEVLSVVDSTLAMGQEETGVDLEEQLLRQLDGLLSFYMSNEVGDGWTTATRGVEIDQLAVQLGIKDSTAFRGALEALMECDLLTSTEFTPKEIDGQECFVVDEGEPFNFGFAILPRRFVMAFQFEIMKRCLQSFHGVPEAGALSGTRLQGAFDENLGACVFTCLELSFMRGFMNPRAARKTWEESDGEQGQLDPFAAQFVAALKRTESGFDLRAYIR